MRREYETSDYYTQGNVAYQVETMSAMPDYREKKRIHEQEEKNKEQRLQQREARLAQERILRANKRYALFLTMGVIIFGLFAGAYIKIQSDITARLKTISKLESQIADLKAENDEAYKRINTVIDLDAIKNTAINELGMFYATQDQIVYYKVEDDDYMNQYIQIPTE